MTHSPSARKTRLGGEGTSGVGKTNPYRLFSGGGAHIFHETVFTRRFAQVPELIRMGAHIEPLALPVDEKLYHFDADLIAPPVHAIQITGATSLHGATVHANDVRAGAALVLAGLTAKGQTIVMDVEQIERGYEAFIKRLRHFEAAITLEE